MKKLYVLLMGAWLAWLPMSQANAQQTDRQKLAEWFAKQDVRGGTLVDLNADLSGVLYMRGASYGQKGLGLAQAEARAYMDLDLGGVFKEGERAQVLLLTMLHPANVAEALWRRLPFKDRVKLNYLPDVEIGPAIKAPMPGQTWRLRESVGVVVALGF